MSSTCVSPAQSPDLAAPEPLTACSIIPAPDHPNADTPEGRRQTIAEFIAMLYPSRNGFLNLFTDDDRSHWHDISGAPSAIADAALGLHEGHQVWFMPGLTARPLGEYRKGKECEIISVPGLHADVDWLDPVHESTALPPNMGDALALIRQMPLPPTLILNSGHGLQPWWLFHYPTDVSTEEARKSIKGLLRSWQGQLRGFAAKKNWTVDSTHNLDRLMRLPATDNRKRLPVVTSYVVEQTGRRYSPQELEAALPQDDEIKFSETAPVEAADHTEVEGPMETVEVASTEDIGDEELLERARSAANSEKFVRLFDGSTEGYKSPSEAVQALIDLITFWAKDDAQIRRVADRSVLCQNYPKWSERGDIPERAITKAQQFVKQPKPLDTGKTKQADVLVALCDGLELFHDADQAYATVTVDNHQETHAVARKSFKEWLCRRYWQVQKKAPSPDAVQEAVALLTARAKYEGPQQSVGLRVSEHQGNVYLDLGNDQWEAVEITRDGWRVLADPPVRFIRKRGMRPLPHPTPGGSLEALRRTINAGNDDNWHLIVGWLLGSLNPRGPYPPLVVNGEQGSAKSTTCRMLRALIDPNEADLRSVPRDEHDLVIAASNSRVVAFDNISTIPPWLSDALCRIATGSAYSARTLYSDDEETLFVVTRPILINGIEDLASRPDLLERSLLVQLPTISDDRRRSEQALWEQCNAAKPAILGALLDAVVAALRHRDSVKLERRPRMADFVEWVAAAEMGGALPWAAGAFMRSYLSNLERGNAAAVEQSPIGPSLDWLMEIGHGQWSGTVGRLLTCLNDHADQNARHRSDWPSTPKGLSGQLRRLGPSLRSAGIEVEFGEHTRNGTQITIRKAGIGSEASL